MTEQGATEPQEQDRNIVQRMAAVMRDVEHVGKTGQNRDQNYSFRPVDEFMNALHGPLVRHEVVMTPRVLDRQSFERDRRNRQGEIIGVTRVVELLMEFTFSAPDGSVLKAITAGEGADVADKATNKAMAAALKYAIMQTFMVPTRELSDGDAETPDVPSGSRQQAQQQAGAAAEVDALQAQAEQLGREGVLHMLDEACGVLEQSRAKLTEKWRRTYDVGAVANLEDETKVPTVELLRFVLTLAPYVRQARERMAREADAPQGGGSAQAPAEEPAAGEPEQQTHEVPAGVLCTATQGSAVCTRAAGHDGEHTWWGATA